MRKPNTLLGKLLFYIDFKVSYNLHLFLKRRDYSIDGIFLGIYTLLQLFLIILTNLLTSYVNLIISFFIIFFLFFISLERLILYFKSKEFKSESDKLLSKYYEMKKENEELIEENNALTELIQNIMKNLK